MNRFSSVSIQERVDFAKNLSIMLKSGIAINEALTSLGEQSQGTLFGKQILSIRDDTENGTSLSVAFGKHTDIFGNIFVSMIKAGEQSGTLQENFQFLADWLERSADLNREVNAAILYPKMVFSAAVVLGGCLATFILPKLVPLFVGLHVELPLITKILLAISLFVQRYWAFVLLFFIAVVFMFMYLNTIRMVKRLFHRIYIRMPFLGLLMRDYQLALITKLFGTLLKSGLSLNLSIEIVSQAATNVHYQDALIQVGDKVLRGEPISQSLQNYTQLFPMTVINIISIGEKSGTLTNSFEYLSDFYIKEVNIQTKKLPLIVEPILLFFIAGIVGFIALAIIMPIYELTGSISR